MRKTVMKLFWIWQFEKEEKWLNEMAAKGLCLTDVFCCRYAFEDCEPGEYAIRLEMLDNWPTAERSRDYIAFVEDTGAEYVGSVLRWVYFRKKTADGGFDLYSDLDSRLRHLNGILLLVGILGAMNFLTGVCNPLLHAAAFGPVRVAVCLALFGLLLYAFLRLLYMRESLRKQRAFRE